MGVSLHSKIHPLFMKYSNGTSTQCHAYQYIRACFLCFFYNPYMSLFNSKNFFIYYNNVTSYTCVLLYHVESLNTLEENCRQNESQCKLHPLFSFPAEISKTYSTKAFYTSRKRCALKAKYSLSISCASGM